MTGMQQQKVQRVEDPNGIPTCTPRIMVQRYDIATTIYVPFQRSNLWKGSAVTINGTWDGNVGDAVTIATDPPPFPCLTTLNVECC
jgi:hypothetical protein